MKDTVWNYWPKKSELWWARYRLVDCVGVIQSKDWQVPYLPKPCLDCASVQLLGTPASDISW